jgi:hypothetical protein
LLVIDHRYCRAAEVVTPLNNWSERIDITSLGTTVELALSAAFAALFGSTTGQPITCSILYGYEVVPPHGGGEDRDFVDDFLRVVQHKDSAARCGSPRRSPRSTP